MIEELETYANLLEALSLKLVWTLETHVHADHVTAAAALADRHGSRAAVNRAGGATCAHPLTHGDRVRAGTIELEVRETPGHTDGCVTYVASDRAFTGDALLIGGCGRTDFQQGDPGRLYDSLHAQVFTLPPDTLLYPAHDYKGRTVTTVKEELATNARLGGGKSREEFVAIMNGLQLPRPKQIDRAVPANLRCGRE